MYVYVSLIKNIMEMTYAFAYQKPISQEVFVFEYYLYSP